MACGLDRLHLSALSSLSLWEKGPKGRNGERFNSCQEPWGLRDGNGLRVTYLPATGFDHEFPGQVRSWLWLQGADDNALVQRITGYNLQGKVVSDGPGLFSRMLEISLGIRRGKRPEETGPEQAGGHTGQPAPFSHLPMVEDRQRKGLPLGVSPQIGLKAERVNGGDESFDGVERGAWDGCILSYMPPATEKQRLSPVSYRDQKRRRNLAPNVPQCRLLWYITKMKITVKE